LLGRRRGLLWGISVVKVLDEHERTMAFAEVALGQIRSLRQAAVPRNYEIWYIYATGYNAPLNKIINETLARHGKLSEADLEQIYETYLSHLKTTDRIDKVGARVIGEIDAVMQLLTDALGMSATCDASLSGASEKLSAAEMRSDQSHGRNAAQIHPRDARHQQGPGRAPHAVEE
jgi:diguanylate cyclase